MFLTQLYANFIEYMRCVSWVSCLGWVHVQTADETVPGIRAILRNDIQTEVPDCKNCSLCAHLTPVRGCEEWSVFK